VPPEPAAATFTGRLVVPVAGRLVRGWGAPTEDGPSTGIAYGTPPGAFVVAPCPGRVLFAAPFRTLGKLVILDCGQGYAAVLAGLGRVDVTPGRRVRAGEPLGAMPEYDDAAGGERPGLYVELRRAGQPVNPAPFLGARG
jgi:septal ring factor EnvC (AmiA/AmiB activator)